MRMRMIPNYPRGVEAVQWKHKDAACWSIYYTQPDTIGARERLLGTVRKAADTVFVIPSCEHPTLRTLNQAVWWLYGLTVGLHRAPSQEEIADD